MIKIKTKANELLDRILTLSRVHDKSDKIRSILIDVVDGKTMMFSSGTFGMSQGILNSTIIEFDKAEFIPTSVIPYLRNLGQDDIIIEVSAPEVIIKYNRSKVQVNQILHLEGIVSLPVEEPEWLTGDFSRVYDIIYANDNGTLGGAYNVVFVHGNKMVTTDRFRLAMYKFNGPTIDEPIDIPAEKFGMILADGVRIGIGENVVRAGNEIMFTTFNKTNAQAPAAIDNLLSIEPVGKVGIDRDMFVKNIKIASVAVDKDNTSIKMALENDALNIEHISQKGPIQLSQGIDENEGDRFELNMLIDCTYLKDVINTLKMSRIYLSIIGQTLCIEDGSVFHYILPRVRR